MTPLRPIGPPRAGAIPRRTRDAGGQDPVDFAALRRLTIDLTQAASGAVWTDYNLHDPGVTILEQLCYAMTELAYRADFPVADHLTGVDGKIKFEAQALFAPEDIFPCRPTSEADYRRLLLDRIPQLGDVRLASPAGDAPPGLYSMRLRLGPYRRGADEDEAERECQADARKAFREFRNLAEDLEDTIQTITPLFCELEVVASIEGMRDPIDIVAEIYAVCAAKVGGLARPVTFDALIRQGRATEDIFDGPPWVNGVVEAADLDHRANGRLSLSDLRTAIVGGDGQAGVAGVVDVSGLMLRVGDKTGSQVITWDPTRVALRLRTPGARHEPAKPGLVRLKRRDVEVAVDAGAVARRFIDRTRPSRTSDAARPFSAAQPPPSGVYRPPLQYRSVREQFPAIYGLQRGARPGGATDQLKAYLAFFDHVLANGAAQLDHVRDLFSPDREIDRSYWRSLPTNDQAEGVEDLFLQPRETVEAAVYVRFDDAAARRSAVLDYLLSLYGETLAQNTTRQFLDYLDSTELAAALLQNKAEYLKRIVVLGRDRAAGFDYSEDLWGSEEHTTGFQRRLALLVGFAQSRARRLTTHLGRWQPAGEPPKAQDPDADARPLSWPEPQEAPRPASERPTLPRNLHGVVFANGLHRNRYHWRPHAARGGAGVLLLSEGPREGGEDADKPLRWWSLGEFGSEDDAQDFAVALRRELIELNNGCDGLHIVEHILLRRRAPGAERPHRDLGLRVTLVLPKWTARTSREAFRKFFAETAQINCPAHVLHECLWLELPQMRTFEQLYGTWLKSLREATKSHAAYADLDAASDALAQFLAANRRQTGAA